MRPVMLLLRTGDGALISFDCADAEAEAPTRRNATINSFAALRLCGKNSAIFRGKAYQIWVMLVA